MRSRRAGSRHTRRVGRRPGGDLRDPAHRARGPLLQGGRGLSPWVPRVLLALACSGSSARSSRSRSAPAARSLRRSAASTTSSGSSAESLSTTPSSAPTTRRRRSPSSTTSSARPAPTTRSTQSTRWSRSSRAPATRGSNSATSRWRPTTRRWPRSRRRRRACRRASGSISTPSSATSRRRRRARSTNRFLRDVAEAIPKLDVDQWQTDFDDPATENLVRQDAMLAAQLKLPAEPAVVVCGPAAAGR